MRAVGSRLRNFSNSQGGTVTQPLSLPQVTGNAGNDTSRTLVVGGSGGQSLNQGDSDLEADVEQVRLQPSVMLRLGSKRWLWICLLVTGSVLNQLRIFEQQDPLNAWYLYDNGSALRAHKKEHMGCQLMAEASIPIVFPIQLILLLVFAMLLPRVNMALLRQASFLDVFLPVFLSVRISLAVIFNNTN